MAYSQSKISTNHGVFSNSDVTDAVSYTHLIFKSEFTYFSIWSDYSDFNTDLEEEADVNEEGNEDCSAVL